MKDTLYLNRYSKAAGDAIRDKIPDNHGFIVIVFPLKNANNISVDASVNPTDLALIVGAVNRHINPKPNLWQRVRAVFK